jgi:hypothetical protein
MAVKKWYLPGCGDLAPMRGTLVRSVLAIEKILLRVAFGRC